jgi:uncharacterized phage protein (TIGR01671 family)
MDYRRKMEMREILFRGKRKDTCEWIYGSLILLHGRAWIKHFEDNTNNPRQVGYGKTMADFRCYEVILETVGQFTGLLDKNGKKIFEGDILNKYYHNMSTYDCPCAVVEMKTGEEGDPLDYEYWVGWMAGESSLLDINEDAEVIGNIHDNPELLEVKK